LAETQQAPPAPEAAFDAASASQWLSRNAVTLTAVLLIGLQLWWKAGLIGHSFFRLDDYLYLERAFSHGLSWNYLMWVNAGHLTPVGLAIAWVLVRISPYDWTLTSAFTLVLLAFASLALLRMLRMLFGDRPGILILLVIYLVSPLSFPGLAWWSVSLELLPLQIAMFGAVTAHLHYLRNGRFRHAAASGGWLLAGMASSYKGAVVPILLFAVTSGCLMEGAWAQAAWTQLRDHWRAWLLYAVLTAGYAVVFLIQIGTSSDQPGRPGAFTNVFSFAGTLVRDTFVPGAFGGPWRWFAAGDYAVTNPPAGLARFSWALAVAVVLVSVWYRPRAWRTWAILAGWLVVADILPVLFGRSAILPGQLLGQESRYVMDAIGVLVLCLGLAFLPVSGQQPADRSRLPTGMPTFAVIASVLTAVVIGSFWSFHAYEADTTGAPGRSYIATARIALAQAPKGAVIVDTPVPQYVMDGLFIGPVDRASNVLGPLVTGPPGQRPRFVSQPDGTFGQLLEYDGYGRLAPAVVFGTGSRPRPPGRSCWPARGGQVIVPLTAVAAKPSALRIGYLASAAGQVVVEFGGQSLVYNVQQGLHSAFLPVQDSASSVVVETITGPAPCIGDAEAGVLLPSASAPAIPPLAVTG
jgi:hypothetical protein